MTTIVNLTMDQGATFVFYADLTDENNTPINLYNYSYRSSMRKNYMTNTKIDLVCSSSTPNTGNLVISLAHANTANVDPGRYFYDVEIVENSLNTVTRVLEGQILCKPEATR